jgi:hypothetical protein
VKAPEAAMESEFRVEFKIFGNTPPQEITDIIGITPTRTWRKGESNQGLKLLYKENGWGLSSGVQNNPDIEVHLKALLERLLPKAEVIKSLCKQNDLGSEFSCYIDIVDETPIFNLDAPTIAGISSLNSTLDIDIIVFSE